MRLKDKVAIITGSSRGIGKGIAEMFVNEGAKIVLVSNNSKELKIVNQEIKDKGGESIYIEADMQFPSNIKNMVNQAYKHYGSIDILINNAGLPMYGFPIEKRTEKMLKRFSQIMDVNFKGYWHACSLVVKYMKKKKSASIINISSVRGQDGLANESAYCSAKGAVNMLTKSLAVELAPYNIRVNTISPGAIQVKNIGHWVLSRYGKDIHKEYQEKFTDIHLKGMKLNQPLYKIGRPEDVAYAAVYLASEESRFVTGSNLTIDGGLTSLLAEHSALDLKGLHDYYEESEKLRSWLENLD